MEHLLFHCKWNKDTLIQRYLNHAPALMQEAGLAGEPVTSPPSPGKQLSCPVCLQSVPYEEAAWLWCNHACCKVSTYEPQFIMRVGRVHLKLIFPASLSLVGSNTCWPRLTSTMPYFVPALSMAATPDQPGPSFFTSLDRAVRLLPRYVCMYNAYIRLSALQKFDTHFPIPQFNKATVRSYVERSGRLTWCRNPQGCDQVLCRGDGMDTGTCSKCYWSSCFSCHFIEVCGDEGVWGCVGVGVWRWDV